MTLVQNLLPSDSKFGEVASGRAVSANPAALGGGKGVLTLYLKPTQVRGGARITTPFVSPTSALTSGPTGACI